MIGCDISEALKVAVGQQLCQKINSCAPISLVLPEFLPSPTDEARCLDCRRDSATLISRHHRADSPNEVGLP